MIVDTMSFKEISDYLWKTIFSTSSLRGVENIYARKRIEYQSEIKKWMTRPKSNIAGEKYRIFRPVYYKGRNDEKLCVIFYSDRPGCIYFVSFLTFWKSGRRYLAFRPASEKYGRIIFYSFHAFHRYAERFMGEPDAPLDDEYLGDILIYNNQTIETQYTYGGKETTALISGDGAWLAEYQDEDILLVKTFISESEYFKNQKELDKDALDLLKKYKKEVWDDTIERGS